MNLKVKYFWFCFTVSFPLSPKEGDWRVCPFWVGWWCYLTGMLTTA